MSKTDRRRYGVIEVEQVGHGVYHLTIGGVLWSEVEWSPSRRTWCVQDAAGRCLAHCDHIVGQDVDQHTAVVLAKAMIRDGRMPTPEEAHAERPEKPTASPEPQPQRRAQRRRRRRKADLGATVPTSTTLPILGEPMPILEDLRGANANLA